MDAFSGTTSQPTFGSLAAALRDTDRDPGFDAKVIREISFYWEAVRTQYRAFESDLKGGASEVYLHEMPGGQFTNLKEQARSLGLESRWHEVARTYADVNQMFGDIVKVTPSSKVVGDMALAMVSSGLTRADVEDPNRDVAFPDSVVGFFAGDLGQPPGGFPKALQKKVLKGRTPLTERPGSYLKDVDIEAERGKLEKETGEPVDDFRLASHLMYPKVYGDFLKTQDKYGPTAVLPTAVYFYGLEQGQEIFAEIERGKTMVINYLGRAETNEKGQVRVFFDLNGQPRTITVPDRLKVGEVQVRAKAALGDAKQVGAPMPGVISGLQVKVGDKVSAGDVLLSIEAMKMETAIHAELDGVVAEVTVKPGDQIDSKDLLVRFE